MNSILHVDNLSAATTEGELRDLFSPHGKVVRVSVPLDRASGRTRGFGFVTMATFEAAQSAMQAISGRRMGNNILTVSPAWPQEQSVFSSEAS